MYAPILIDLSQFERRLDALSAADIILLKGDRLVNLHLLKTMSDGDKIWDEDANEVEWTPEIKAQVQAEIAEADRIIQALSDD